MGDWGPGVLENDAAQDVLSIEIDRWRELLDRQLSSTDVSWQSLQGDLVYVYLLSEHGGRAGELSLQHVPPRGTTSSAGIAVGWRSRYLEIWEKTPYATEEARTARRDEIVRLFDKLIRLCADGDAPTARRVRTTRASRARK